MRVCGALEVRAGLVEAAVPEEAEAEEDDPAGTSVPEGVSGTPGASVGRSGRRWSADNRSMSLTRSRLCHGSSSVSGGGLGVDNGG